MAVNTPSAAPVESKDTLNPNESLASSPHTLMAALDTLKAFASGDGQLQFPGAAPDEAKRLLSMKDRLRAELPTLASMLESKASTDVKQINNFLKSKGFDIRLRDQGADGVYVASVFKQEVEWLEPGSTKTVHLQDGKEVPGVGMKHVPKTAHTLPNGQPTSIYTLQTKNGDTVHLMPWKGAMDKNAGLKLAGEVVAGADASLARNQPGSAEELHFPMVNLDEKVDLKWLEGASIGGVTIKQALAQFKLKMDEKGASAEAAVALGATRGFGPMPDVIDGPMVVWFKRGGVTTFSAIVGVDDFKRPDRKQK